MDNYYVESPVWMVDLGKETTVNGVVAITWQGAGQGKLANCIYNLDLVKQRFQIIFLSLRYPFQY
jgi:hypothetical protein